MYKTLLRKTLYFKTSHELFKEKLHITNVLSFVSIFLHYSSLIGNRLLNKLNVNIVLYGERFLTILLNKASSIYYNNLKILFFLNSNDGFSMKFHEKQANIKVKGKAIKKLLIGFISTNFDIINCCIGKA